MLRKYPRTRHIAGSCLQPGDEDLQAVPFEQLLGRHVVVEEKMDGANCGISFDEHATLRLQSRGHYLTGGPRERQFALLKQWAARFEDLLFDVLGDRYVVYGEWLYAKHTVFYDALPHYFMEFDVLDRQTDRFLDTPRRTQLLAPLPVVAVKVLFGGRIESREQLWAMTGASHFITPAAPQALAAQARRAGQDPAQVAAETDTSGLMEGLYLKIEEDGFVQDRFKVVRRDFITRIVDSESHWNERPILPNLLRPGVSMFETGSPNERGAS